MQNIHPLTEFKRNANSYIEQIRETLSSLVLTVNGKAAVVVQDAAAFQSMLDQIQSLETALKELKRLALQRELDVGLQQLEQGQYSEYNSESLPGLFDEICCEGRAELKRMK